MTWRRRRRGIWFILIVPQTIFFFSIPFSFFLQVLTLSLSPPLQQRTTQNKHTNCISLSCRTHCHRLSLKDLFFYIVVVAHKNKINSLLHGGSFVRMIYGGRVNALELNDGSMKRCLSIQRIITSSSTPPPPPPIYLTALLAAPRPVFLQDNKPHNQLIVLPIDDSN